MVFRTTGHRGRRTHGFQKPRTRDEKRPKPTVRSKLYIYAGVNGVSLTRLRRFAWHTRRCGPRFRGRCAGLFEGTGECVSEQNESRPRLSKRRRENSPAGTKKRREVWVTVEEEAALVARAEREKVTVPNLLISTALSEHSESPTERRAIAAELMSLHNLLARSSNNINQLARQANATLEFPAEAREALKHIRTVAMRIDDAIDGLM
jgi:hypothetical protein